MISKSTRHIEPFGLLVSATSLAWKSRTALNPFWTKAESLGILVFIHPQGNGAPSELGHRFRGNGYLSNVIGNPLETSIALSHLIFDGTLDRYPRIKICAAHGGGTCPPMPVARTLAAR